MLIAVASGGAIGAVFRYLIGVLSTRLFGTDFPVATLIVNVSGSLLMGILIECMALKWSASTEMRGFIAVGILGAFTTFSTFSLDAVLLYERGRYVTSALYIGSSVILSIIALFVGFQLARKFLV